jgi:hypothetical protein
MITVATALIIGFLTGLISFKIKQRWCPVCGASLQCPTHGDGAASYETMR